MIMRRRPLLRAAVVGGGAYAMGKRSAQRSAEQDQQSEQQQAPGPAAPAPPSMLDQLNQLTALHQQGALTDAEFDAAKAKLLGS
jgi:membrane protease subunit (stomatin/prohibitin family)